MEESFEVHSEDNEALPEKHKKRKLKTPSQVEALEKFYNEHKYPSEEMKSQLAGSLGLTEKQVSGWFCHRRLKDKRSWNGEVSANGRPDRLSGIVQDRGSGHRQDSCGSTKQGDNKHFDPREVESRGFSGQEFSAANLACEHGDHHNGNSSDMDVTSSDSSLRLQHRSHPQNEYSFDVATSRYPLQNENTASINLMGIRTRIGPSGYLKVKGQVENVAITAIKRQLGSHYREDGPLLGIQFDLLPSGAFESSASDPLNEPYYFGDPDLHNSPDGPRIRNQPNSGMMYEVYNSKMSSHDLDLYGTSSKIMHGSDHRENCFSHQSKPNPLLPNRGNPFPCQNSSIDMDEGSAGEMSVYESMRLGKMRPKHDIGGRRIDSVSSHHLHPYDRKVTGGQTEPWLCNPDDVSSEDAQREHFESKHFDVTVKRSETFDTENKRLSRRMAKVAKRDRDEFPQQHRARKTPMAVTPPCTNHTKRSTVEIPSSFSEDETAETSSSGD